MSTGTDQWRSLDDAQRAQAYSPSSMLDGPLDPYIADYVSKSAAAYATLGPVRTVQYAESDANTYDLFFADTPDPAPCHVFIHGGYWQELSKRESVFAAPGSLARGMHFAAIDYTLAPAATLEQIISECEQALQHIHDQAPSLGIDPRRIIVSGSSAGAHLAAMATARLELQHRPKALLLLSGIYDLRPLVGTYINDALGLDQASAQDVSPAFCDLHGFPDTLVACGQIETEEFKRQSADFAEQLRLSGAHVQQHEIPGRNHFDVVHDLTGDTVIGRAMIKYLNLE